MFFSVITKNSNCSIRNAPRHSAIPETFAEGNLYFFFNVRRQIIAEAKLS